jgi:hypothetical protein
MTAVSLLLPNDTACRFKNGRHKSTAVWSITKEILGAVVKRFNGRLKGTGYTEIIY